MQRDGLTSGRICGMVVCMPLGVRGSAGWVRKGLASSWILFVCFTCLFLFLVYYILSLVVKNFNEKKEFTEIHLFLPSGAGIKGVLHQAWLHLYILKVLS